MSLEQCDVRNRLLALMSPDDFRAICPYLEAVDVPRGFSIAKRGQPIEYCYFFDSGIGSVVAETPEGLKAEVGIVGRDGILPLAPVLHRKSTPYDIFVQVSGHGHRIALHALTKVLAERPTILALFLAYTHAFMVQASYTALSNAVHPIDERLARWLLMCADRSENNTIALSHDILSAMLAVRRPSVTVSLHVLKSNGFINTERSLITIRDRAALEAFAADCYGVAEREYENEIGPMR